MILAIKILFTLFFISLVVGLFLAIRFNWDEKSKRNKRLERALDQTGLIIIAIIALIAIAYGIHLLWF